MQDLNFLKNRFGERAGIAEKAMSGVGKILKSVFAGFVCLTLIVLIPVVAVGLFFLASIYVHLPSDEIISEAYAPGSPGIYYRLWRVPWKGLGGGADTFALQLVSLRRHKEVQVFGADEMPLEIVWRDATNLEIAVPNKAFVGDHPRDCLLYTSPSPRD